MIPGISTACFYPTYTELALSELAKYSPKCVEIFLNAESELEPCFLKTLRKLADDSGIKIVSVHPFLSGMEPMYFFSNYKRRFSDGLEIYKKFYAAANILGAEIVVFHGAMKNSYISYNKYFDSFSRIWSDAKKHGVELCQENICRCTSFCSDFFVEMARELPDVNYVFDVKQAVRAKEDVYDFAIKMDTRIKHVHISDHDSAHDCLVPGKGTLNIAKLLDIIGKNGFKGSIVVELYRDNYDSIVEIYEGYQQLCTSISTYNKLN